MQPDGAALRRQMSTGQGSLVEQTRKSRRWRFVVVPLRRPHAHATRDVRLKRLVANCSTRSA
jgi:hypothetical protein